MQWPMGWEAGEISISMCRWLLGMALKIVKPWEEKTRQKEDVDLEFGGHLLSGGYFCVRPMVGEKPKRLISFVKDPLFSSFDEEKVG